MRKLFFAVALALVSLASTAQTSMRKFNEARSKYRGSGAGEKQKARM